MEKCARENPIALKYVHPHAFYEDAIKCHL